MVRINGKVFALLVGGAAVAGVAVHLVHGFQVRRNADAFVRAADRAERAADEAQRAADQAKLEGDEASVAENKAKVAENKVNLVDYLERYLQLRKEDSPENSEVLRRYARNLEDVAFTRSAKARVASLYEQFLRREPKHPQAQELRRRLVNLQIDQLNEWSSAARNLDVLLAKAPNDAVLKRLRGRCAENGVPLSDPEEQSNNSRLSLNQAYQDARKLYRESIELVPEEIETYSLLAHLLHRREVAEPDEADEVMKELIERNPNSAEAYLERGLYRYRYGLDDAWDDLEVALQKAPKNVDVLINCAQEARGDAIEVVHDHLERALEGEYDLGQKRHLYVALADLELRAGQNERVLKTLRRGNQELGASQHGDLDPELTTRLAALLLNLGRVEEAWPLVKSYRQLVGRVPMVLYLEGLHTLKSLQAQRADRYADAISPDRFSVAIKKLNAIRPKSLGPWALQLYYSLGEAYAAAGQYEEALDAYQQASRESPAWPAPRWAIARLLVNHLREVNPDRQPEALLQTVYKQAKEITPRAQERFDLLALARIHDVELKDEDLGAAGIIEVAGILLEESRAAKAIDALKPTGPDEQKPMTADALKQKALDALKSGLDGVSDEERPALWAAIGQFHLSEIDLAAAQESYERWSQQFPQDPRPVLSLLDLALQSGDRSQAEEQLQRLQELDGNGNASQVVGLLAKARIALDERLAPDGEQPNHSQRLEQADSLIANFLQRAPDRSDGYLLLGQLRKQQGRIEEAAAAEVEALKRGAGETALRALNDLLEEQWRRGDKEQVAQLVRTVVEVVPENLDAQIWGAQVFTYLGRLDESERVLLDLTHRQSGAIEAWLALLKLRLVQDRPSDAEAVIDQIRKNVESDKPSLLLARCYRLVGDREKVEELFRESVKLWPDDASIRCEAAAYFVQTEQDEQAIALLKDDFDPEAIALHAALLIKNERPAEAVSDVERLETLEPDALRPAVLRARLLHAQNQPEEAARLLGKALKGLDRSTPDGATIGPELVKTLAGLNVPEQTAEAAYRIADLWPQEAASLVPILATPEMLDKALPFCERIAKLGETRAAALQAAGLARGTKDQGTLDRIDRIVALALEESPGNADLLIARSYVRHNQARYQSEVEDLQAAWEGHPRDYLFLNNLAWTLSEHLGQHDKALQVIDKAIARNGPLPGILDTKGVILLRLNRTSEAAQTLQQAIDRGPSGVRYYHLAQAFLAEGQKERYRQMLTQAVDHGLSLDRLEPEDRRMAEELAGSRP